MDNLTLRNYEYLIFKHEMALSSIWKHAVVLGRRSDLAVLIGILVAYVVNRKLVRFAGVLAFLAMAPFVIPGIVMAIGFYAAYAGPAGDAVRHRAYRDPGLHRAVPADRVRQLLGGAAGGASRDGRKPPASWAPGGCARCG